MGGSSISDWEGPNPQLTLLRPQTVTKTKRPSRIEGPILSQKLSEDQKKLHTLTNQENLKQQWPFSHKFIIAGIAIGGAPSWLRLRRQSV